MYKRQAEIHTEILKDTVLADWYKIYPERFQNKTNGITQRRWLALCNRPLSAQITELLGTDQWMTNLDKLKEMCIRDRYTTALITVVGEVNASLPHLNF